MSIDIKHYTSIIGEELDEVMKELEDHDFTSKPLLSLSEFKDEVLVIIEDVLQKRNKYLIVHEIFNYLILDSLKDSNKLLCILDYIVYLSKIDSSFSDLPNELLESIRDHKIFPIIRPCLVNSKRFDYEFKSNLLEVRSKGKSKARQGITLSELTRTILSKKSKVKKQLEKKKGLQEDSLIIPETRSLRKRTSKAKSSTTSRRRRSSELDRSELKSDELIPSSPHRRGRRKTKTSFIKTEPDIENEESLLGISEEDEYPTDNEESLAKKKKTPKKRTPKSYTKGKRRLSRRKNPDETENYSDSTEISRTPKKRRRYDLAAVSPANCFTAPESDEIDVPDVNGISYPTKFVPPETSKTRVRGSSSDSDSDYSSSDPETSPLPPVFSDSDSDLYSSDGETIGKEKRKKNKKKATKKKASKAIGKTLVPKPPKVRRSTKGSAKPAKPKEPKKRKVPLVVKEDLDFLFELIEKEFIRTPTLEMDEQVFPRLYKPPFYHIFTTHNSDDPNLASNLDRFFFEFSVQMIKKCNDDSIDPTIFIHEREYNYVMQNLSTFKFKLLPSVVFGQRKMLSGVDENKIALEGRPLVHTQVNNLKQITVFNTEDEYIQQFKNIVPVNQVSRRVHLLNSIVTDGKSLFLCREIDLINECMKLPKAIKMDCWESCLSSKSKKDDEINEKDDEGVDNEVNEKDGNNNQEEPDAEQEVGEGSKENLAELNEQQNDNNDAVDKNSEDTGTVTEDITEQAKQKDSDKDVSVTKNAENGFPRYISLGTISEEESEPEESTDTIANSLPEKKKSPGTTRAERLLTTQGIILNPFAFSKILSIQNLLRMITNLIFPNLKISSLASTEKRELNKIPNSIISGLSSLYLNFRPYLIEILYNNFNDFFNLPQFFKIDSVMFELELGNFKESLKRGVHVLPRSKPAQPKLITY